MPLLIHDIEASSKQGEQIIRNHKNRAPHVRDRYAGRCSKSTDQLDSKLRDRTPAPQVTNADKRRWYIEWLIQEHPELIKGA